jgi:hypothetical protein
MRTRVMTHLIRDRDLSVVAADIPPAMTVAQYRKRQVLATGPSGKSPIRRLMGLQ